MTVGPLHPPQSSHVQATWPSPLPSAHAIKGSTNVCLQSVSPNSPSRMGARPPTPVTFAFQQDLVTQLPKLYTCHEATNCPSGSDGM